MVDADLRALAGRIASGVWRKVPDAYLGFDADDLQQEALLSAWRWSAEHKWNADDHAVATTVTVISRDLIDYMRKMTPLGRRAPDGSYPAARRPVRSLDEPVGHDADAIMWGQTLPDKAAQADIEKVERDHDFRQAFRDHRGNPRAAAVAWLVSQGHTLAAIGEHYGFTEARARRLRNAFIRDVGYRWSAPESEADPPAARRDAAGGRRADQRGDSSGAASI